MLGACQEERRSTEGLGEFLERAVIARVDVEGSWQREVSGYSAPVTIRAIQRLGRVRVVDLPARLRLVWALSPPQARSLRVKTILRLSKPLRNGFGARPRTLVLAPKSSRLVEVVERASGRSEDIRSGIERKLPGAGTAPESPHLNLAGALWLGDRSRVSPEMQAAFVRWGIVHLVSVSGLHLGVMLMLVGPAARQLRGIVMIVPVLCVLLAYVAVLGPKPSLLRAGVMTCVGAAAGLSGRRGTALTALGSASLVLLVLSPELSVSLAFQLSVAGTFGLVVFSRDRVVERGTVATASLRSLVVHIMRVLRASLGAQVATVPWAVSHFGLLCWWSFVLTPLLLPCLVGLMLAGLVLAVLPGRDVLTDSGAWSTIQDLLEWILRLCYSPFEMLVAIGPSVAVALPVKTTMPTGLTLAALGFVVLLARRLILKSFGCWLLAVALLAPERLGQRDVVAVHLLDVGQGDAILFLDRRHSILVDGGGWRSEGVGQHVLLPTLAALGVRRLDAVVVSHADNDHCSGLLEISRLIEVERLIAGPDLEQRPCGVQLTEAFRDRTTVVAAGDRWRWGELRMTVLSPLGSGRHQVVNDSSLVMRIELADEVSMLLTGDITAAVERRLLESGVDLEADWLKVAHHGSKTSSTGPFLEAVSPRVAVVGVGRNNRYGHPAPAVVDRIEKRSVTLLRTDLDGRITLALGMRGETRLATVAARRRGLLDD